MTRIGPIAVILLFACSTGCWWAGEDGGSPEITPGEDLDEVDDLGDLRPASEDPSTPEAVVEPPPEPEITAVDPTPPQTRAAPRRQAPKATSRAREERHDTARASTRGESSEERRRRKPPRKQTPPEPPPEIAVEDEAAVAQPPPPVAPLVSSFSVQVEAPLQQVDIDPTYRGPHTGADWLQIGYDRKAEGDLEGARVAFETALEWGADPQTVSLELGYLALEEGRDEDAREHFRAARRAATVRARQARSQLQGVSRPAWGEFYGEAFGWHRFVPEDDKSTNLVPVARLRGYLHPIENFDLDPYVFLQISRDTASTGRGPEGYPLIYADNTFMFGGGVLLRLWKKRLGFFAQVGPAVNLLDDGRERVWFDFRAGAFLDLWTPGCRPALIDDGFGAGFVTEPCAELYTEAVYVSRFDHNLMAQVRGRIGMTWLITGPVAWQPVAEGRVFKDIDNDFWNNLADFGGGHRWRLMQPFQFDLVLGIHFGTYFGLENENPAPDPHYFSDLRLQAATGFVF